MRTALIAFGILMASSMHVAAECTLEKTSQLMMAAVDISVSAAMHPEKHPPGAAEAGQKVMEHASARMETGDVGEACSKFANYIEEFDAL